MGIIIINWIDIYRINWLISIYSLMLSFPLDLSTTASGTKKKKKKIPLSIHCKAVGSQGLE